MAFVPTTSSDAPCSSVTPFVAQAAADQLLGDVHLLGDLQEAARSVVEATRQEVAVLRQLEEATEQVEQLHLRVVQGKAAAAAQREAEEREGAEAVAALVAAAEGAWEQQGAWQQVRAQDSWFGRHLRGRCTVLLELRTRGPATLARSKVDVAIACIELLYVLPCVPSGRVCSAAGGQ